MKVGSAAESTGRESRTRETRARARAIRRESEAGTTMSENKRAPGASHHRLNLTDLWFDDRLPRRRSLIPGGLDGVAFTRIAIERLAGTLDRFPHLSSSPRAFLLIHIPVSSFLGVSLVTRLPLPRVLSSIFLFSVCSFDFAAASPLPPPLYVPPSSLNSVVGSPRSNQL